MTSSPGQRPLRADARRNAERLVGAAREVFAERGVDVPLDDIARHAGVGNATLYRRFPTRQDLLEAVYRDRVEQIGARAAELLATTAPDEALTTWLLEVVRDGSSSRGFTATLKSALQTQGVDVAWCRNRIQDAAEHLLTRAQKAGAVRPDVTAVQLLKLANGIAFSTEHEPDADHQAEQLLTLTLTGLRPS
ncbi:TetR/AcrR family transcriptional regulator [Actinomadura oligospora]|uniref:TetR/AcrR family transcriptional regulator n=1 Tax=Actinomadura oligospora TaxID=111804 RepID=UPI0004795C83|nr:TetR/AcrR family transcriptional regulator [Actinomadura oligospora]